ncbi:MAG: hypothetical protein RMJ17_03460 [Candidatus Aenigmarchaeota archaeon]|nr:hypothetical protein [Candidatus Aenigmarchaeota archaeon]MDW8149623.1 hypothetical protein [Candidatus Aenigmarchaeota archaeon]
MLSYKFIAPIILAFIVAFIIISSKQNINLKIEKGNIYYCEKNEECVPKDCCHSTECVNIKYKPNCEGIFCTMECRTILDCGMGYCGCVNNRCVAIPIE